jgi:hypothetical protein
MIMIQRDSLVHLLRQQYCYQAIFMVGRLGASSAGTPRVSSQAATAACADQAGILQLADDG